MGGAPRALEVPIHPREEWGGPDLHTKLQGMPRAPVKRRRKAGREGQFASTGLRVHCTRGPGHDMQWLKSLGSGIRPSLE